MSTAHQQTNFGFAPGSAHNDLNVGKTSGQDPGRTAMDFYEPTVANWFATMTTFEDEEAIEEEWFDCPMVDLEY